MHHIARQHDIARPLEVHEHRLMPWRVTWRRQDREATIAEQVLVTLDQLHFVIWPERLLRQGHRIAPLRLLNDDGRLKELVDIAAMVWMHMRERNIADMRGLDAQAGE